MPLRDDAENARQKARAFYREYLSGVSRDRIEHDLAADRDKIKALYREALAQTSSGNAAQGPPPPASDLPLHVKMARLFRALSLRLNPTRRLFFGLAVAAVMIHLVMIILDRVPGITVITYLLPLATIILFVLLMLELLEKTDAVRELTIARDIQLGLMPRPDLREGSLEISSFAMTARDVGGDYLDVITRPDGTLVIIADVSGKGLGAALYMVRIQALARRLTSHGAADPAALLIDLNESIKSNQDDRTFATAIAAFFPNDRQEVVIARAGHHPAILFQRSRNGAVSLLPPGIGLGMASRAVMESSLAAETVPFETGDCLLLYTDGLIESRNRDGEEFGEGRLRELMNLYGPMHAGAIVKRITDALDSHATGHELADDVTLSCVRRVGSEMDQDPPR